MLMLVFGDAGRCADSAYLCNIAGLLVRPMQSESIFHVISWNLHKARRPVKTIGVAETLAAGDAIDICKIITKAYAMILRVQANLIIAVNSKDLFTTAFTQSQSLDKSIRRDVGVIHFEFGTKTVSEFVWIPGKLNIANAGTKFDSPLVPSAQQLLQSSTLRFDFCKAEFARSDRPFG